MLPKIIDLFSGCGGLALGFEKAGFDIVAGIELMPEACKTISYNLSWRYGKKETHICGDITEIEASVFKNSFGDEGCIVIGGPPCQAYSMAGRGKLRSLGEDRVNVKDAKSVDNSSDNLLILCPNHHSLIHALNPEFDYDELQYIYPDGTIDKIVLDLHLTRGKEEE